LNSESNLYAWRLAAESVPLDEVCKVSGLLVYARLTVREVSPSDICSVEFSEALGAWRYATPARRSGSG